MGLPTGIKANKYSKKKQTTVKKSIKLLNIFNSPKFRFSNRAWKALCERRYVKEAMWKRLCERSYVKEAMWKKLRERSYVKEAMWKKLCERSSVKEAMWKKLRERSWFILLLCLSSTYSRSLDEEMICFFALYLFYKVVYPIPFAI